MRRAAPHRLLLHSINSQLSKLPGPCPSHAQRAGCKVQVRSAESSETLSTGALLPPTAMKARHSWDYNLTCRRPTLAYRQASRFSRSGVSGRPNSRRVGSGFGYKEETPLVKGSQCATIKYVTRPLISNERLSMNENGDLLYELKTPWSDASFSMSSLGVNTIA